MRERREQQGIKRALEDRDHRKLFNLITTVRDLGMRYQGMLRKGLVSQEAAL